MSNEQSIKDLKDYALAYLLIDLATLDDSDCGSPMSDEELSLLFEPTAKSKLGERRCNQLLVQISQDQTLYERWLMLSQSQMLDGAFTTQAQAHSETPKNFLQTLLEPFHELSNFLTPKLSYASAFVLVVVTAIGTVLITPKESNQGEWTMQPSQNLPQKASTSEYGQSSNAAIDPISRISNTLTCSSTSESSNPQLCYTATPILQNWFIVSDTQVQSVSPAPVSAQKINSVRTHGDVILVEYVNNDEFALSVLRLSLNNKSQLFEELHTDSAPGGYFDEIQMTEKQLNYIRYDENEQGQPISIPLN